MKSTPGLTISEALESIPQEDLKMFLCAHVERPEGMTNWFDPSVTDEKALVSIYPTLNMYDEGNTPPISG